MNSETKLACPHCGNIEFERTESVRVDIVQMLQAVDDKGNKSITDEVIDAGETEYDYKCRGCNRNVTEDELVEAQE